MSNLPLGAEFDSSAPFNIEEVSFRFDISIKGIAWYEYQGKLNVDEAIEAVESRIRTALNTQGDIEVSNIDISIY